VGEFCLDLRGWQIPFLENLSATNDQFAALDLTDNQIARLELLPPLLRLSTLLLSGNRIVKVEKGFADHCPKLESLILTNNRLSSLAEVDKLAQSCPQLLRLSLKGNLVASLPHYRAYVIHRLPNLRVLDFQKVGKKERVAAAKLF
jgi:U2 small nuclear ribonucleoprotein A'